MHGGAYLFTGWMVRYADTMLLRGGRIAAAHGLELGANDALKHVQAAMASGQRLVTLCDLGFCSEGSFTGASDL
jgi:hypothetical protein